ncbi:MAG: hypothetical protein V7785_07900 [Bermanella sp.]
MRITKQLKIAGNEQKLVSDSIRLEMQTPGRCVLTVKSDVLPVQNALIEINGSLGAGELRRLFLGYIDKLTIIQDGLYKIVGRELSATLNRRVALNLRHVTPAQVLEEISHLTSHEFILPNSEWKNKTVARFQHIGGGYGALDYLLSAWRVEKGFWHQQANGQIYVGECEKSVPGQKIISIDAKKFESMSAKGGTLPLVPRLRPGVQIDTAGQVNFINSVDIVGETMRLNWLANPWEIDIKAIQ